MVNFQNKFVYQPTFNMLKYENTSAEYGIGWKSKHKHIPLNSDFLPNIIYFLKNRITI